MKNLAIILSLMIFTSSVNSNHLSSLASLLLEQHECGHMTTETTCESDDTTHDSDTKSHHCCEDGSDCHCSCCFHSPLFVKTVDFSFVKERFACETYEYAFDYLYEYSYAIFHPPTLA